jgi:hypothetical protein
MRIISLDLLLGTPRLQRRIDAELALLQRDIAVVGDNTQQLRAGISRKATSLPALAAAGATGFLAARMAVRKRRGTAAGEDAEPPESNQKEKNDPRTALGPVTSLAWQVIMPLLVGWIQARFSPVEVVPPVAPAPAAPPTDPLA